MEWKRRTYKLEFNVRGHLIGDLPWHVMEDPTIWLKLIHNQQGYDLKLRNSASQYAKKHGWEIKIKKVSETVVWAYRISHRKPHPFEKIRDMAVGDRFEYEWKIRGDGYSYPPERRSATRIMNEQRKKEGKQFEYFGFFDRFVIKRTK